MQNERIKKTKLGRSTLILGALVGLVVAVLAVFFYIATPLQNETSSLPTLQVNNQEVYIEIARTPEEQARGLCCRDSLPDHHGMLFIYDQPGDYGFWMKDTRIPLDMYWIDSKKTIVHIEHSVQPDSYPHSFRSPTPAQYILETNAGYAKKHGITVGDTVSF